MAIEITMPRLSDTMETGTIIKWNISEGDAVSAGDVIADVETDKATMEMQAFDDGTLAAITVPEGQSTDVGTVIALLAEEDEDAGDVKAGAGASGKAETTPPKQQKPTASQPTAEITDDEPDTADAPALRSAPAEPARTSGGRIRVSPVARHLAEEHNIDLRSIQGSGPSGRIVKSDILSAIESGQETAAAVPPSAITRSSSDQSGSAQPIQAQSIQPAGIAPGLQAGTVPLSNMRQVIARRLVESTTTIPHYQVTYTFSMDALMEMRKSLNAQLESQDVKLSVNDFIVRATALAMYKHPQFNASWGGDSIVIHPAVNIGIAISLPAERGGGLVVATIRHADQKALRMISAESKMLAAKARDRGLALEDMSDSTFTLSNLGMFGVDNFTAIINPPNSAILAVGAAIQKPVVRDGELAVGWEMAATLSSDHRIIDGAMAAQYLATMRELIENPAALLV